MTRCIDKRFECCFGNCVYLPSGIDIRISDLLPINLRKEYVAFYQLMLDKMKLMAIVQCPISGLS